MIEGNINMSDGEKKEKGTQQERKVPLLKLFSFADLYDCVLMGVGSVGACIHGASVPIFFVFFGKIINVIGLAYLFPKEASHEVAKVCLSLFYHNMSFMYCPLPMHNRVPFHLLPPKSSRCPYPTRLNFHHLIIIYIII